MENLQERRGNWWSQNWKWCVPVGCLGALAAFVGFILLIVYVTQGLMRSSDVYQEALRRVRTSLVVEQALGTPVEPGWFVTGNIRTSGASGEASLSIPLKGSKSRGVLYAEARRLGGQWQYTLLVLELNETGKRFNFLEESSPGTGSF